MLIEFRNLGSAQVPHVSYCQELLLPCLFSRFYPLLIGKAHCGQNQELRAHGLGCRVTINQVMNGHGFLIKESMRDYAKLPKGPLTSTLNGPFRKRNYESSSCE